MPETIYPVEIYANIQAVPKAPATPDPLILNAIIVNALTANRIGAGTISGANITATSLTAVYLQVLSGADMAFSAGNVSIGLSGGLEKLTLGKNYNFAIQLAPTTGINTGYSTSVSSSLCGTYFYRVVACDNFNQTQSLCSVTTDVTASGLSAIVISWQPSNGALFYRIYRSLYDNIPITSISSSFTSSLSSYTDSGLDVATTSINLSSINKAYSVFLGSPSSWINSDYFNINKVNINSITASSITSSSITSEIGLFGQLIEYGSGVSWTGFIGGSGGGGGSSKKSYAVSPADKPPSVSSSYDDEFDDAILNAKWSWLNQLGANASTLNGQLYITAPSTSGALADYLHVLVQNGPASPFTVTCKVFSNGGFTNYSGFGIGVLNTSNDRVMILATALRAGGKGILVQKWNNYGSYNTDNYLNLLGGEIPYYLQIRRTGTTIDFNVSLNGLSWYQVFTESAATFIENSGTINKIFITSFMNRNTSSTAGATFDWFRVNWTPDWNPLTDV